MEKLDYFRTFLPISGDYDVIYVGFPIWWFNAPMAVGTFLESYDLGGKKIVPFCTSQDNGIDVSMDYIREVCGDAEILEGLRIVDRISNGSVGRILCDYEKDQQLWI